MMKQNKYTIGIDPGMDGAVAIICDDGMVTVVDTPTATIKQGKKKKRVHVESEMARLLVPYVNTDVHVFLEKIHSMPGQGVRAMFSMGEGYGLWRGILAALKIPYTLITPQSWKKAMMNGMGKEKAASCYRAQQLFPDANLFGPKGGAKDGRGDALLIAEYGRNQ
jgi:crossover junction endodeoxyribonuclease RuvC